ncbi:hypothetical protein AAS21_gp115 [Pantoea phage vB_PagS_AAS21]|uniref:Uncharacterized protein n=1 Tax=Pantoea phage vB_PagS_AAS21 TaxID=2575261 RepID=A0A4Y5P1Y1_9CAUD|nr:hypothetical protein AAS21_gp115 [Pantoea phage vB_PagS_AAS21]
MGKSAWLGRSSFNSSERMVLVSPHR